MLAVTVVHTFWSQILVVSQNTRPDTRHHSRRRLGRGTNAETALNSGLVWTDGRTDRRHGKVSAFRNVSTQWMKECPFAKGIHSLLRASEFDLSFSLSTAAEC